MCVRGPPVKVGGGLVILGSKLRDKLGIISPLHLSATLSLQRRGWDQGREKANILGSPCLSRRLLSLQSPESEREQKLGLGRFTIAAPASSVVTAAALQVDSTRHCFNLQYRSYPLLLSLSLAN